MAGRTNTVSQQSSALNPTVQLRTKLISEGFEGDVVDKALEEMWNKHLPYDDFDAVLAFLRKPTKVSESNEEENTAETSFDEEVSSGGASKGLYLETTSSLSRASSSRSRIKRSRRLGLASKLDLVADYENFTDAVFALTEWTTKVAKQAELEELCEAIETNTLPTIVRRAIMEDSSPSEFEQWRLPSTLHLIGCVLLSMGLPSSSVSATRKNLEVVLKQTRRAFLKSCDDEAGQALAENVSRHVVARFAKTIREFKASTEADPRHMIHRLENEIESAVMSISTNGDNGIMELMLSRDMQKELTEKSSVVVGVSIASLLNQGSKEGNASDIAKVDSAEDAKLTKQDFLKLLVGDDNAKKIETTKSEHETLKAKAADLQSDLEDESKVFESKLSEYRDGRAEIAEKIEELRRTIQQLEQEDIQLSQKIAETEVEAEQVNDARTKEVGELSTMVRSTTGPFEFAIAVQKLATGLKVYDDSLKKASAVSSPPMSEAESKDPAEEIPRRMGVYLVHARNYFRSEAKCLAFLRGRLKGLESDVRNMERDRKECTALGMTTNASQISKSLSRAHNDIRDDNTVVKGLRHEVQMMCEDLVARVENYTSSEQGRELTPLHISVLHGIIACLEEIGVESTLRLQAFLPRTAEVSDRNVLAVEESDGNVAHENVARVPGPLTSRDPHQDNLKPRLTWAKPKEPSKLEDKKTSLLEIQREQSSSSSVETLKT